MKLINALSIAIVAIITVHCSPIKESESAYKESDLPYENEVSLLSSFESDKLDSAGLVAYDKRAIERSEEFFEYMSIVGDSTINDVLRKKAMGQFVKLFEAENGTILNNNIKIEPKKFIEKIFADNAKVTIPSAYQITSAFDPQTSGLTYNCEIQFVYEGENVKGKSITVLTKAKKVFGDEKLLVWEVYLKEVWL